MTTNKHIVAKEGYVILFLSTVLTVALFFIHLYAGIVGVAWVLFCIYFFRNPCRKTPQESGLLIAPADGKVIFSGKAMEPDFLKKDMQRITIFMSPFNVHVNRVTESGTVQDTVYHKGKFLAAFSEEASSENERSVTHLKTEADEDIVFVQIAGWFARRIVSYPKAGDKLKRGDIFGVIKFGSRMDIYFPDTYKPKVKIGDKVHAGKSIIAGSN